MTDTTDITVANDLLICANYLTSHELITKAQAYFVNRSIPLDERWANFCVTGRFIGRRTWTYPRNMRSVLSYFFEEDSGPLQLSRHQEMNTVDMVETLETFIVNEEYNDDYDEEVVEWAENTRIRDIKEEVLLMFLWSFKLDY